MASSDPPRIEGTTERDAVAVAGPPPLPLVELRALDDDLTIDLTALPGAFTIGRQAPDLVPAIDVALPARYRQVSVRHVRVDHQGERLRVVDNGAKNGVTIDERRVHDGWVYAGGVLGLGPVRLIALDAGQQLLWPHLARLLGRDRRRAIGAALAAIASTAPLLLLGASGSPHDRLAWAIHETSPWSGCPFVRPQLDRASIEPAGAPDQGTLFIDLVSERSSVARARAWLAQRGQRRTLIAARDSRQAERVLGAEILGLQVIAIPPLAERASDVPSLLDELLRSGGIVDGLDAMAPDERRAVCTRSWPGNLAELEAAARHLVPYLQWGGAARAAPHTGLTRQGYVKLLRGLFAGQRFRPRGGR